MGTAGGDARGKVPFEPPPWEREAFDALAERRAAEKAAREALVAAEKAASGAAAEKQADPWAEEPTERVAATDAPAAEGEDAGVLEEGAPPKPDDRMIEAMLIQLQGEERSDGRATAWVGWVASAMTFVLGLAMLVGGFAIVRNGGGKSTAVLGSAVLSVFGLCFIGMAVWVWISTSRSRGR